MLVNCVAYEHGKKLDAQVAIPDVAAHMRRPDCFVWVAIRDPEPAELEALAAEFGLHPLAVEDARHGHQRPKLEEYGQSLFVVLHTIELDDGAELRTGEVAIYAGEGYVLSVRRATEHGFNDVRSRSEQEPELLRHGPGYVLYALMDAVVDRYFPVIDALEDEIESIEEHIFLGEDVSAQIQALYHLKRKLMTLKHATGPLLEATAKLNGARVPVLCAGLQDYFRDVYDHVQRLDQSIDNFRETVTTAISVNLSLITIQESEVTKRLAAYAALVAAPTLIASVYGMNFEQIPELQWTFGYPVALGAMALIDAYLFYRFRKAKWL
jgi:magnesium transporter